MTPLALAPRGRLVAQAMASWGEGAVPWPGPDVQLVPGWARKLRRQLHREFPLGGQLALSRAGLGRARVTGAGHGAGLGLP